MAYVLYIYSKIKTVVRGEIHAYIKAKTKLQLLYIKTSYLQSLKYIFSKFHLVYIFEIVGISEATNNYFYIEVWTVVWGFFWKNLTWPLPVWCFEFSWLLWLSATSVVSSGTQNIYGRQWVFLRLPRKLILWEFYCLKRPNKYIGVLTLLFSFREILYVWITLRHLQSC